MTSEDIGGPVLAGSTSYSNGVYTVNGGGNDISNTYDKFQFASESLSGDGEIIARIDSMSLDTCDWALSGVMLRENDSPGSLYALVAASPNTSLQFQWRSKVNDGVGWAFHDYTYSGPSFSGPVWVKLVRHGNDFSGFYSDDGVSWTQIGGTAGIAMSNTVRAGLAVAANNDTLLDTTQFSNVSIAQKSNFGWLDGDIGSPTVTGSTVTPEEGYVVTGGGQDVYGNNQHFYFDSQSHTGDGELIARVDSLTNSGFWSMGGVMFRDSTAPNDTNAPFAMVFATPNYEEAGNVGGVVFQWSSANGGNPSCVRSGASATQYADVGKIDPRGQRF